MDGHNQPLNRTWLESEFASSFSMSAPTLSKNRATPRGMSFQSSKPAKVSGSVLLSESRSVCVYMMMRRKTPCPRRSEAAHTFVQENISGGLFGLSNEQTVESVFIFICFHCWTFRTAFPARAASMVSTAVLGVGHTRRIDTSSLPLRIRSRNLNHLLAEDGNVTLMSIRLLSSRVFRRVTRTSAVAVLRVCVEQQSTRISRVWAPWETIFRLVSSLLDKFTAPKWAS